MQTFLPYPDFAESASSLDDVRCRNQRRESVTILGLLLTNATGGWANHPATLMWKGYEHALIVYTIEFCKEVFGRGFNDYTQEVLEQALRVVPKGPMPHWLGQDEFHASHRSNLLRKDRRYYSQFGWTEPDDLPYIWPKGRAECP